ncbi:hypothetical protein [Halorhabdus amylolytica]|uniref:hypothetical protein n=1 Tax=Halorhabdus amylolytica TaxID=2559573 RepID=UPI0010A9A85D|nr:hypothetical protein [Halorhabdus amylolytica]
MQGNERLVNLSGIGGDNIYPNALRAAAGLFWADLGLEAHYLQAIMGWNCIDVTVAYLRVSGRQLAQRIEHAFSVGGLDRPDPIPDEDLCPPSNEATKQVAETDGVTTPGSDVTQRLRRQRRLTIEKRRPGRPPAQKQFWQGVKSGLSSCCLAASNGSR